MVLIKLDPSATASSKQIDPVRARRLLEDVAPDVAIETRLRHGIQCERCKGSEDALTCDLFNNIALAVQ